MEPKRTVNYYDCYEVGYNTVNYEGKGDPSSNTKHVIAKTLDKEGVEALAKKYGIEFINDAGNRYSYGWITPGYYFIESETTRDPETFIGDPLRDIENVFKQEAELRDLYDKKESLEHKLYDWDNWIQTEDGFATDPNIEKEYEEAAKKYQDLANKLHYTNYNYFQ